MPCSLFGSYPVLNPNMSKNLFVMVLNCSVKVFWILFCFNFVYYNCTGQIYNKTEIKCKHYVKIKRGYLQFITVLNNMGLWK